MPDDAPESLSIHVLGPVSATRGAALLPLGGRQQRAVLAVLVTRLGAVVTMGQIADAIWGEDLPPGHVQTVQTYISHLRSILGLERSQLATVSGGYRLLLPPDAVDSQVFHRLVRQGLDARATGDNGSAAESLTRALGLWAGDVMADLADYPFVADYAAPLTELRLTAVEACVGARLDLGDHRHLVAELEELVANHPLRVQLHAQRILALYRSGRQADALRAYRSVRTLLDDELGVRPGPDLQRLHERVLAQDPGLDYHPPRMPSPNGAGAVTASAVREGAKTALASPAGAGNGTVEHAPLADARQAPEVDAAGPRATGSEGPVQVATAGTASGRRRVMVVALVGAVALAAGTAAYGVGHWRTETLPALPANALGSVEADGTLRGGAGLGPNPTALTIGAGSLWALSGAEGRLYRIDPRERRVSQTIPVGHSPVALTVTGHDVWVVNAEDGTVSRVNSDVNSVVDTVAVGTLPHAIASGPSGVWVANRGDNTIQRIDPTSGKVDAPIPVGGSPSAVAVLDGAVYVANEQDRSVVQVNPSNGEQVGGPIAVGAGPRALAVDHDDLWVANADDQSVTRVDRSTGREVARIAVGDGPGSLAVVDGRIWVASEYDGTVSLIDPARNAVEHRYGIGASPRAVAAGDSALWVVSAPRSEAAHVGGVVTSTDLFLPGAYVGIDPSSQFMQGTTFRALRLVYDGLVALRYAAGPDSFTLVPDLATAIPRPTNGGKTYAFTVRHGIRFSDGSTMRASDIKRGVFRSLTINPGHAGASKIVGAAECVERPATCTIDRGVVVDDEAGTVVFHLTEPNPDFLFQLTYFGQATVPGAPPKETLQPLPGTGPYMIAAYSQGKAFALERNPFFTQWSFAAQPAGYPDRIDFAQAAPEAAMRDIEAGRADVLSMGIRVDPGLLADVARRYPNRVTFVPKPALDSFLMNSTASPFDDVRVRRAVNYAVDRRILTSLLGGRNRIEATCQMLPANLPGYRPYCPYSVNPSEGPYAGADLTSARALVEAAGKVGARVTVNGYSDPRQHAVSVYLVRVLNQLGFKATLAQEWPDTADFFDLISHPERPWQIVRAPAWLADWPAASNFYFALFACHEFMGVSNPDLYCNTALDAVATTARALENTDPTGARRLWAEIDRQVTDDAPAVFLFATRQAVFVSARAGNVQVDALGGPLLSQLWVK